MEKKQYYIVSPRNFANEYTLLYVENAADRFSTTCASLS